ncbi:hypothetical protein BS47DRAFT_273019 [Hydnum rufescens UP504]|uniref:Uncharacterized protein n=1 Tax=Hydnum rufescens UP504 TaxID=1448309 RepID=A0A9P6AM08_9AGAM|nr:hypothetical protein BS47DRAFT_273019 [Hydnum rufescens UP504]
MRTYKQGLVFGIDQFLYFNNHSLEGGLINYSGDNIKKANPALENFSATNALLGPIYALSIIYSEGIPGASLILFYNGLTPPEGLFSDFLAIISSSSSLSTGVFLNFIVDISGDYLNSKELQCLTLTHFIPFSAYSPSSTRGQ